MTNAKIDENRKPTLIAVSSADGETTVRLEADPDTGSLLTTSIGGTLVTETFDTVTATYPDTSTEVYTYTYSGDTVATVTVVYTDAITKQILSSVVRS